MAALTGRTIRASYIELLKLNTASTNTGVTGSLIDVTDGGNTASALSLSTSQIASSVDGSAGTAAFTRKGDTNTGVFFPAADTIAVTTNGTERMRVTSTGFVGIGTASPAVKLDVSGGNIQGKEIFLENGAASSPALGTTPSWYSPASGVAALSTNAVERLRIDSSGNVGVGTTSPNARLNARGNGAVPFRWGDSSDLGALTYSGSDPIIQSASGNLLFYISSSERLRITSTGNVGIGMTPTAQLELSTDSAKKPSTNTWTIASDQRLKTNITNADNNRCYEIVKQVPLKRYTWKSEVYSQDKVKDRSKLGWIAQDVEEVFPKAVGTSRFAYNQVFEDVVTPELDSEGNAVFNEDGVAKTKTEKRLVSEDVIEDCRDLNADQMYAAMYGTIQKLIEKVETLEAKVVALQVA